MRATEKQSIEDVSKAWLTAITFLSQDFGDIYIYIFTSQWEDSSRACCFPAPSLFLCKAQPSSSFYRGKERAASATKGQ